MKGLWKIGVIVLTGVILVMPQKGLAGEKIINREIYFRLDKDFLTREAMDVLKEVAQILKQNPGSKVILRGHTCDIASDEYNQDLSARRTQSAANFLTGHLGISSDRISTSSSGEKDPKYDNSNSETKKKNRRVEIVMSIPASEIIKSVYTSVVDDHGDFITDLPMVNFKVFEGGQEKEIVRVSYEVESYPSAVVMILDKSGSMQGAIENLKDAARSFVNIKKPNDRVLVIGFSSDVATLSDFETDVDKLNKAIDQLKAKGQTVLYDALYEGAKSMRRAASPRLIILMTDGVDEGGVLSGGSSHTLEEAIEAARLNEVTVYTIGLGNKLDPEILKQISSQTNGVSYFAADPEQLKEIYSKISTGTLKGKYRIDFKSREDITGKKTVKSKRGRLIGTH